MRRGSALSRGRRREARALRVLLAGAGAPVSQQSRASNELSSGASRTIARARLVRQLGTVRASELRARNVQCSLLTVHGAPSAHCSLRAHRQCPLTVLAGVVAQVRPAARVRRGARVSASELLRVRRPGHHAQRAGQARRAPRAHQQGTRTRTRSTRARPLLLLLLPPAAPPPTSPAPPAWPSLHAQHYAPLPSRNFTSSRLVHPTPAPTL